MASRLSRLGQVIQRCQGRPIPVHLHQYSTVSLALPSQVTPVLISQINDLSSRNLSRSSSLSTPTLVPVRTTINLSSHKGSTTSIETDFPTSPSSLGLNEDITGASALPPFDINKATPNDVTISTSAVEALHRIRRTRGQDAYLRITVDAGGCSGFQYAFSIENAKDTPLESCVAENLEKKSEDQVLTIVDNDCVFSKQGSSVAIDDISMPFMKGAVIEYKVELIRSGFAVKDNPNVELACGCGTSFSRKQKAPT